MRNVYKILIRKPEGQMIRKLEGQRSLRRPRHRWENNIRMDLREIGWETVDWIYLSQNRDQVMGSCEYGNEPLDAIKCREFLTI